MTNEEILKTPDALLGALERQRKVLLQIALVQQPCPFCNHRSNLFEAAGIGINDYTFGATEPEYLCPRCGVGLRKVVPFIATTPWFWMRMFNEEGCES